MILHLLYIVAFTVIAFLAVGNLIQNLMTLGIESQRGYSARGAAGSTGRLRSASHPELLDNAGNLIDEPLLVMRSMSVDDAREHLDALYEASPGSSNSDREES